METILKPTHPLKALFFSLSLLPLIGHAQQFNTAKLVTETPKSNFENFNNKAGKPPQIETLDSKLKAPPPQLQRPQWFNPEFQKLLMGGVVTGGGNEYGVHFHAVAAKGLNEIKHQLTPNQVRLVTEALEKSRILFVDEKQFVQLDGVTQDSVAINNRSNGIVTVSEKRWEKIRLSPKGKAIATHEILSLVKLEDTGRYPYSSKIENIVVSPDGDENLTLLYSRYTEQDTQGFNYDSVVNICERVKQQYTRKYYIVYCSYLEKPIYRFHRPTEYVYGLNVYGIGELSELKWKTVFSSLGYGSGNTFSDLYSDESTALAACYDTMSASLRNEPYWTAPRCVIETQNGSFYYKIQTQNPLAK